LDRAELRGLGRGSGLLGGGGGEERRADEWDGGIVGVGVGVGVGVVGECWKS